MLLSPLRSSNLSITIFRRTSQEFRHDKCDQGVKIDGEDRVFDLGYDALNNGRSRGRGGLQGLQIIDSIEGDG